MVASESFFIVNKWYIFVNQRSHFCQLVLIHPSLVPFIFLIHGMLQIFSRRRFYQLNPQSFFYIFSRSRFCQIIPQRFLSFSQEIELDIIHLCLVVWMLSGCSRLILQKKFRLLILENSLNFRQYRLIRHYRLMDERRCSRGDLD